MNLNRITKARNSLTESSLSAVLLSNPLNIYYLTGLKFPTEEREAYLLLTRNEIYIFTDPRNSGSVLKLEGVSLIESSPKNPFLKNLKDLSRSLKIKRVGFESDNLIYDEYKYIGKQVSLIPLTGLVEELRMIKEAEEIENIRKACQIGDEAFKSVLSFIKEGVTEKELSEKLEVLFKDQGGSKSFDPIVAFGPNSAIPHHSTSDERLEPFTEVNSFFISSII